ncbi:hypothetical protein [Microbacterium azadirachtae]|uniref:hypothetical protein n=1 Tax=Microbacterium azadirachtae TaxID=582680 RepID=UPI003F750525
MSTMDPAPGAPAPADGDGERGVARQWHPYVPSAEVKARMDALERRAEKPIPIPSFPPLPA